jgi:Domain of unknown function (DUF4326)/SprT-like family
VTAKAKHFQADWKQAALLDTPAEQALDRLAAYWDEANTRWFGGEMKPAPIVAGLEKTKRTMESAGFDFSAGRYRYRIRIRESLLDRLGEPGLYLQTADVLLHEMIHQYLATRTQVVIDEPEHGPEFTAWCNKIGSALGLGEVVARKPRGQEVPLSRYWPHCVRPDGAYALTDPRRVHWNRHAGQPLPRRTVLVTRASRYGNPFLVATHGLDEAIRLHREWLGGDGPDTISIGTGSLGLTLMYSRGKVLESLPHFAGWDLACNCPDGQPCHADVLLELANAP